MECQNYIRVLLVNKTEVMTCGTNAFQPLCISREVEWGNSFIWSRWHHFLLPPVGTRLAPRSCVSFPGGQHQQSGGARKRRGALPVRPSPQLHGGGNRKRGALRRHRHRLLGSRPRHLQEPGRHAAAAHCPVQLQVAERYKLHNTKNSTVKVSCKSIHIP